MASIVYLDVDDEITSAASRIRGAEEPKVALVVPLGSRLATSRINFRLLAREAQSRGRRLAIVAGDAATRSLAASAGLPIFATVAEFETAEAATAAGETGGNGRTPPHDGAVGPAAPGTGGADAAGGGGRERGDGGSADEGRSSARPGTAAGALAAAALASPTPSGARSAPGASRASGDPSPEPVEGRGASIPVIGGRPRRRLVLGRPVLAALVAVMALALLATGVGAYLLLPSAEITLATRTERVGPLALEVRADPSATQPEPTAAVVPAERLAFDVAAEETFPATGKRVEATRATGRVTFRSKDPTGENRIASGAIVSTPNGIRFRILAAVTIPKATIVGLTIVPGEATVRIEAVDAGPGGNVEANAITVIPSGEDPTFTEVRNAEATSGGRRQEFPRVSQGDVDAALAALQARLQESFAAALEDPDRVPPGLTLFPETRELGEPVPTVDPASLVDQEIAEFQLGLAATGTVVAVDEAPIDGLARSRISSAVGEGYRLLDGSIEIRVGEPALDGEVVVFPVTATAAKARVLDTEALREEIQGKPIAQARSILERYGAVEIRVWPEWVTAIPTLDHRIDLRVREPDQPAAGEGSPVP